ncbi:MAG TPA: single-stranded DNA-binding protein [Bacteroidia bacterium]|nr:single-stranded DNA-binding protein [Bacteroidia bacterium]HNU31960.1 single-stranded DNA-binding protein [Bacteroidia bacterium]
MSGINKVILVGNLGKDPEVRHLEGNVSVAKFSLATTEFYKNKDGNRVETTEWHNIVMWRGLADSAEKILKKGSLVYIEGKIRTRNYDDKDGHKRYITEIVADTMTLLNRKSDGDGNHTGEYHKSADSSTVDATPPMGGEAGDDLPF